MFTPGEIEGVLFKPLKQHADVRGWLIELFRDDEMPPEDQPRMGYVSETLPGVARGPHEHVEQSDYFLFLGPGDFKLYLWERGHLHRRIIGGKRWSSARATGKPC